MTLTSLFYTNNYVILMGRYFSLLTDYLPYATDLKFWNYDGFSRSVSDV